MDRVSEQELAAPLLGFGVNQCGIYQTEYHVLADPFLST